MLETHILNLVSFALSDNTSLNSILSIGSVTKAQAEATRQAVAIDVTGYEFVIDKSAVKHAFKQHGNSITETNEGKLLSQQQTFYKFQLSLLPEKLAMPGRTESGEM